MLDQEAERDQRVTAIAPRSQRKPVLATMPSPFELWNRYVEDFVPPYAGTLRDYRELLKLAKDREVIILNGSVGRRQRYRDVVFAIILKWFRRNPPPVLMQDATWEPGSDSLSRDFPFLAPLLPKLARLAIKMLDGPHMRYAVLSTDEVRLFPQVWGVDPHRVVYQPFPHTLGKYQGMPTRDDGYLFAGGNSMRDYDLLEEALQGTGAPTRMATSWKPTRGLPHLEVRSTSHEEFMQLLANAHAVVVPFRKMVRSAGQQTYLNAMLLGKPVIVTEGPGVRDYIIDGVTGVIVPRDVAALRAAILHVMDPANAAFYAKMVQRAQEDVLNRFTEKHYRFGLLLNAGVISREQFERAVAPERMDEPLSRAAA
jgi:glycosyltransferase involved in cell wall biosynthesis